MKILVLNYEFPPIGGGGSYASYTIAKGYAARGHEVDVVTMGFRGLPAREARDGMTIHRVRCLRARKEVCHPWEQATYLVSAYRFIAAQLDAGSYDICHAHFIIPTGWLALRLKKRYGLPYILTSHGSDVLGYNKRFALLYPFLRRAWRAVVAEAAVVTSPSDFLAQRIRSQGTANLITIPNAMGGAFAPLPKEKLILVVSRLFKNKRVDMIIRALGSVDLRDWRVRVVGDGPESAALREAAAANPLIVFDGWLDHDDPALADRYGRAAVFISASAYESFGLTVIEALRAGCYPILSDIPGHREILKEPGHFFSDEAELAEALATVMKRPPSPFTYDLRAFDADTVVSRFEAELIQYKR